MVSGVSTNENVSIFVHCRLFERNFLLLFEIKMKKNWVSFFPEKVCYEKAKLFVFASGICLRSNSNVSHFTTIKAFVIQ